MIRVVAHHRTNHTKIIDLCCDLRKQLTHLKSRLSMLTKLPRRAQQISLLAYIEFWRRLAVALSQTWFGIERVDVRWSAGHEQENHPLGARREVRQLRSQRILFILQGRRRGCLL